MTGVIRLPGRPADRGHRLPDVRADARGRVPQAHRPLGAAMSAFGSARPAGAHLARDQDLPARAARRDRLGVRAGLRLRRSSAGRSAPSLTARPRASAASSAPTSRCSRALLIAISAVLSLVTIIAIYREGGILKRLRATPLRPLTILSAHVLVKLLFTATTLIADDDARHGAIFAVDIPIPWVPFTRGDGRQHAQHPLARLRARQRGADRPVRAADRHDRAVSDDRHLRPVRAGGSDAARCCSSSRT